MFNKRRVCQILIKRRSNKILVQYILLRNKPIFSIVSLKSAILHFLTAYCKSQREGCYPRSTVDMALGKGAPLKLLKLTIKTKSNLICFGWEQEESKKIFNSCSFKLKKGLRWHSSHTFLSKLLPFEELRKHYIPYCILFEDSIKLRFTIIA